VLGREVKVKLKEKIIVQFQWGGWWGVMESFGGVSFAELAGGK